VEHADVPVISNGSYNHPPWREVEMEEKDRDIEIFVGALQKGRLADAGVVTISEDCVRVLRRPTYGKSNTYVILAELTARNVVWSDEIWRSTVLRQALGSGVQLGGVAAAGAVAGYSGMVAIAGSPTSPPQNVGSQLMNATKQMQEMNQVFNLEHLMLQQSSSQENRQFTMISNIMKARHDAARNAIANLR
jgi:hypothetical protein